MKEPQKNQKKYEFKTSEDMIQLPNYFVLRFS
jgi:hypothetical protein